MARTTKNHRKFEQIIEEMFKVFGENKLTLNEISETTKVSKELLLILLNNDSNIITDISRLLHFTGFRMVLRKYNMKTHVTKNTDDKNVIMICRVLEPKCNISYDKVKDEYFNLNFRRKKVEKRTSNNRKQQILADFVAYKKSRIDKNYANRANLIKKQ